jgi:hypothetical protein
MANQIEQLADWMTSKAQQLNWTLDQCQGVTLKQVRSQLPAQHKAVINEILFLKAKGVMLRRVFQNQLESLRNNAGIWAAIKNMFPNATVSIENGRRKRIIIDVQGVTE